MSSREGRSLEERLDALFGNRLTVSHKATAAFLEMHVKTLKNLGDAGTIGFRPKGNQRTYTRQDVNRYLEQPSWPTVAQPSKSSAQTATALKSTSTASGAKLVST